MTKKKAFVLRMDMDKLDCLEKWASDEFRSINGQIEWILDKALKDAGRINKLKDQKKDEKDENIESV